MCSIQSLEQFFMAVYSAIFTIFRDIFVFGSLLGTQKSFLEALSEACSNR